MGSGEFIGDDDPDGGTRLDPDRRRFVEKNIGLAYKFAGKYKGFLPNHYDDILGESFRGLVRSAIDYDPKINEKFSTYAYSWMMSYVLLYMEKINIISVPKYLRYQRKVEKSKRHRLAPLAISVMEMSQHGESSADNVSSRFPDPLESAAKSEEVAWLNSQIDSLDDRSRFVVRQRLEGASLRDVGNSIGCTRERVRQLESLAYAKIRRAGCKIGLDRQLGREVDNRSRYDHGPD